MAEDWIQKRLIAKRNSLIDYMTATFVDAISRHTPVENGHAHEAWCEAAEQAAAQMPKSHLTQRAEEASRSEYSSGDPKATKGGRGKVKQNPKAITVTLENRLPFVYKMEHGLPITVGDDRGRTGVKRHWESTFRSLYGSRLASPAGRGWLFWKDSSGSHFAKVRHPAPTHAVAKAMQAVKQTVQRYSDKGNR